MITSDQHGIRLTLDSNHLGIESPQESVTKFFDFAHRVQIESVQVVEAGV